MKKLIIIAILIFTASAFAGPPAIPPMPGVSISGTPTQYNWAEWTNATTIKGTAVTASKPVCTDANGSPTACAGTEGVWQAAGSYQPTNATLTAIAAQTESQGAVQTYTADNTPSVVAKGTAYQVFQMNSGATAPEWTSTLGVTGTRLTAGFFTDLTVTNAIAGSVTGNAGGLTGTPNITVGTISAGATGFAVDADGDTTAKSITVTKSSGVAGLMSVYEANSTDTSYIGFMGPASISESYSFQFNNSQPSAGQAMVFAAPTGTGDPNGNKVSAQTWINPSQLIGSGTVALGTSEIASGACAAAAQSANVAAIATTDLCDWGFNGDPTSTTGYSASANGMLTIIAYPTSGYCNFKVCNNTSAAVTPGAVTLNWAVRR